MALEEWSKVEPIDSATIYSSSKNFINTHTESNFESPIPLGRPLLVVKPKKVSAGGRCRQKSKPKKKERGNRKLGEREKTKQGIREGGRPSLASYAFSPNKLAAWLTKLLCGGLLACGGFMRETKKESRGRVLDVYLC